MKLPCWYWQDVVQGWTEHLGSASAVVTSLPTAEASLISGAGSELQRAKDILALEIVGTDRGGAASSDQRAGVAEAQVWAKVVALGFCIGPELSAV